VLLRRNISAGLLAALALSVILPAHAQRTVRLTNGEWPPYLSASLPDNGLISRIVVEAFAQQGMRVQFGYFPWPRALMLAKIGDWDGTAAWIISPERSRDFIYSDPVFSTETVFYHLKSWQFSWTSMADLARYRIGVTQDYFYGDAFNAALAQGKIAVEMVGRDEQNLTKLLGGRIDIFPIDKRVATSMLNQHFSAPDIERLTFDPRPVHTQPLHIMFGKASPGSRQLADEFNKGLKKLKASGRLDALQKLN
jgi:polar amino acid transport system substrate-binding protein